MKIKGTELVTFEEALSSTRGQMVERFSKHVSPIEAGIFRLLDADKRYVKAEGVRIVDEHHEEYLDFTAGYGTLCLGHNPPEVLSAVQTATTMPTVFSFYVGIHPLIGALAENLHNLLPGHPDISSFGNGGVEAVEIALKTARASSGKKKFIFAEGSFHGVSFGGLSVTGRTYRNHFEPLLPGCEPVPFGDVQALESKLKLGDVAALIIEPVQAEGGCIIPQEGYLAHARELCDKYGALLIFDEIQTGFGRTGRMFAAEHDGVEPDIFVVGKALSGGVLPLSASVTNIEIWKKAYKQDEAWDALISTFRGNPKACAAALKTIEILVREGLIDHAREMGEYALQKLQDLKTRHNNLKEVRGIGLLLGIKFFNERTTNFVLSSMLNKYHIILGKFDYRFDMLRLQPPLIVRREEIDQVIEALDETCGRSGISLAFGAAGTALGRMLHSPK